jgi:hypothetical protein
MFICFKGSENPTYSTRPFLRLLAFNPQRTQDETVLESVAIRVGVVSRSQVRQESEKMWGHIHNTTSARARQSNTELHSQCSALPN